MIRRGLLVVFSFILVFTMLPTVMKASHKEEMGRFADMPSDWSINALENAVRNGLLVGTEGKIEPQANLTRAQLAAILNRAFGAKAKAPMDAYADVPQTAWYAHEMAKAVKMKTIMGSGNKLRPDDSVTREEAFSVMARALKLGTAQEAPPGFSDLGELSSWAKGEVYRMIQAGYIQGSGGKIHPKNLITRAEFAQLMDNVIRSYFREEGVYQEAAEGNLMINAPGVTLRDLTVEGDLIIGDGVGDGDVILDNIHVTGRLVVRGGGEHSVIIRSGTTIGTVIVAKADGAVRVFTEDGSEVDTVYVDDGDDRVILEGPIGTVRIRSALPVELIRAEVSRIVVEAPQANVAIAAGSNVEEMVVSGGAEDTILQVEGILGSVIAEAPGIVIGGAGAVENVEVRQGAHRASISTVNTRIVVDEGVEGTTAGGIRLEAGVHHSTPIAGDGEDQAASPVPGSSGGSGGSENNGGGGGGSGGNGGGGEGGEGGEGDPMPVLVSAVGVVGAYEAGQTLSAAVSPSSATVNYQWQIHDTEIGEYRNIADADQSTYVIAAGDEGKWIRVVVSGTGNSTGSATSTPIQVQPSVPVDATAPAVQDAYLIDGPGTEYGVMEKGADGSLSITVTHSVYETIDPAWKVVVKFDEEADVTANGSAHGAFSTTYTYAYAKSMDLTAVDRAGNIADYTVLIVVSDRIPVTAVDATGTPEVGETLAAIQVEPAAAAGSVVYQWQRADSAQGAYQDIAGADQSAYTLTLADAGKWIRVAATGTVDYIGTARSGSLGPVIDTVPPVIEGVAPMEGTLLSGNATVIVDAMDDNLSGLEIEIWKMNDAGSGGSDVRWLSLEGDADVNRPLLTDSISVVYDEAEQKWTLTINSAAADTADEVPGDALFPDGEYRFRFKVSDAAGNVTAEWGQGTDSVTYVIDNKVTALEIRADDIPATEGEPFEWPINVKGTVSIPDAGDVVRWYAVIPDLDEAEIVLHDSDGGKPEVVRDAEERSRIGAGPGDLVLAWAPDGGFTIGDYTGGEPGDYDHAEGRTTAFKATVTKPGAYDVRFVFYNISDSLAINGADDGAAITIAEKIIVPPQAFTAGYADEIVLDFGKPMAVPPNPVNGFAVTVDGEPNPVLSTELDANEPSRIRVGLQDRIPVGTVTISYTPEGLETAIGTEVPAFGDVDVMTAGTIASEQQANGATAADAADFLKTKGFYVPVITQALAANGYAAGDLAAWFQAQQAPMDGVGAGLLMAGFTTAEVAAALAQAYQADSAEAAVIIMPMAESDTELVTALAGAGYAQPDSLAKALHASGLSAARAVSAMWPLYETDPGQLGQLGPALTGAGYSLSDALYAVLAMGDGNQVAAAWPDLFGNGGALRPAGDNAANLRNAGLAAAETDGFLKLLYDDVWRDPDTRAEALTAGGFDTMDITRVFKDHYGIESGTGAVAAKALHAAGHDEVEVTKAIHLVFGFDAVTLVEFVLPHMTNDPPTMIAFLKQAGFGDSDVAAAALKLWQSSDLAANLMNQAGYSAAQVIDAFRPILGSNYNVSSAMNLLSKAVQVCDGEGENCSWVYYETAEVASVLQSRFGTNAHATGIELLKISNEGYSPLDVAEVLKNQYKIDGFDFVKIRNASFRSKGTPIYMYLNTSDRGPKWILLDILQSTFDMDVVETASAVRSIARERDALSTVMDAIWDQYGITDPSSKIEIMNKSGYTLNEIAAIMRLFGYLPNAQAIDYFRNAGFSDEALEEAVARYFRVIYESATAAQTASMLLSAGYGSCTDLNAIISTLKRAFGSVDDEQLIQILMNMGGCTAEQVSSALSDVVGDPGQLSMSAVQRLYDTGRPAAQAVHLLREIFGQTDPTAIANVLRQAGYQARYTLEALKSITDLTPSGAKDVLTGAFNVNTGGDLAGHLLDAGYGIGDVVLQLGSTDPLVLAGYLNAANVRVVETLVQVFGPRGVLNQPLVLARNLRALGVSEIEAPGILIGYGYNPAQVGSLLWSNGYPLPYVTGGVKNAIGNSTENRVTAVVKVLKQMTGCAGELNGLPACATGDSTFTDADVIQAIMAMLGYATMNCSEKSPLCYLVFEELRNAGYDAPTIASTLFTDYQLSFRLLGAYLQQIGGYTTPDQVVSLLIQAPFNANLNQLAESLEGTTFGGVGIFNSLSQISQDSMASFRAMKDAGFSARAIGSVLMSGGINHPSALRDALIDIGFHYSVAFDTAVDLIPFNGYQHVGYSDMVLKIFDKFFQNATVIGG